MIERLRGWAAEVGPADNLALLRVGLVLVCWSEWGAQLQAFRAITAHQLALSMAFFVPTTLMLLGLATRPASIATAAVLQWIYWGEGIGLGKEAWTHHHSWVIVGCTSLLALAPAGRVLSLDAWLAERRGRPLPDTAPTWVLRLIGFQLANVYFWGAWDKTTWAFLSGQRLHHHAIGLFLGSDPVGAWVAPLMAALAVATVIIEYWLAFALWLPGQRAAAMVVGVLLHWVFYVFMPVGTFSVVMMVAYLAFVPPEALRAARLRASMAPAP
ncbi:MAG TPA: HTTM domain-containing protein [Myxococcota bacterium]|nr:HTTM domain-containing protein [Myxococcota bacterium]